MLLYRHYPKNEAEASKIKNEKSKNEYRIQAIMQTNIPKKKKKSTKNKASRCNHIYNNRR